MDSSIIRKLEVPARAMGVPVGELVAIMEQGSVVMYESGACLFHESTPREWFGAVLDGAIDIVSGLHGRQAHLATLTDGALVAEGILLDDSAHSTSAFARGGTALVLQVPRAVLARVKSDKPDLYYRLVARIAERISDRLRAASQLLADRAADAPGSPPTAQSTIRWANARSPTTPTSGYRPPAPWKTSPSPACH